MACAVRAITGSPRSSASARIRRTTSGPSIWGSEMSSRTRSGRSRLIPSSASGPVSYSAISYRSARIACTNSRLSGLSSTTTIRFILLRQSSPELFEAGLGARESGLEVFEQPPHLLLVLLQRRSLDIVGHARQLLRTEVPGA